MAGPEVARAKPGKLCLVCTVPIRFTRLGVHACRACAAFFKRATVSGKRFICRTGDGQCEFRKHEKFMCRKCRFDKCVELGMEYFTEGKEMENQEEEEEDEESSMRLSGASPPPSDPSTSKTSLLDNMASAYEKAYAVRLADELEVVRKHKLQKLDHDKKVKLKEEFYYGTLYALLEMLPTIIRETAGCFETALPFLRGVSIEHKAAIFQDFIGKFLILEGFYRSITYLRGRDVFCSSLTMCVDRHNFHRLVRDEDWAERKDDFRKRVSFLFIKKYGDDYIDLLFPLFSIEKFTYREFMALCLILFCDIDQSLELPEEIIHTLESTRKQVFAELQDYYKNEEKIRDVSTRMGMLMTVAHSSSEAGLLVNEEYRTLTALFDYDAGDTLSSVFLE